MRKLVIRSFVLKKRMQLQIRLCMDYRALNSVTQVRTLPMKDSQKIMYTVEPLHLSSIDL